MFHTNRSCASSVSSAGSISTAPPVTYVAACASSTAVAARVAFQSVYVGVESKTGTRATRTTPWNLSVATMPVDDHFHVTTELV